MDKFLALAFTNGYLAGGLSISAKGVTSEMTIPESENVTTAPPSEPSYCHRTVLPNDRPNHVEVMGPPLFIFTTVFIGLMTLYFSEKRKARKGATRWRKFLPSQQGAPRDATEELAAMLAEDGEFLTKFDYEVMDNLKIYCNHPKELVKICIPAFTSLLLTSMFMLLNDLIFGCIWPNRQRPSINTGVTCFLAPAGLVYALSFGFTFQMVLEKQNTVLNKVTNELSHMDQMVTMTAKLNLPTPRHVMAMLKAIKSEVVFMGLLCMDREPASFVNTAPKGLKVHVWSIIDILKDASSHPENTYNLNVILVEKLVTYLIHLNSICTDRMGALHSKIHPLKWVFLELLGSMSLFGVMLIEASSRRMEITLCELTIFSVTMLCYVLADLDAPFNGFFRVDLTLIPEVIKKIELIYHNAHLRNSMEHSLEKKFTLPAYTPTAMIPVSV